MNNHRYQLQKYNGLQSKYACPQCKAKHSFVKYIDTETGMYLADTVGRCDNEEKCQYHYKPKQYFVDNNIQYMPLNEPNIKTKAVFSNERVFIPYDVFSWTLKGYNQNVFINNLLNNIPYPFLVDDVKRVVEFYKLGTITKGPRTGAITFPFIDVFNNVCAVQVKQFDCNNHTISTDFLHSIIERALIKDGKSLPKWLEAYNKNDKKISCLFGAHLLAKFPLNPIALVEAPKSAIYATLYFGTPNSVKDFLWLAVYNLSSLSIDKVGALKGRKVVLFPDLSLQGHAYNLWCKKAKEFNASMPNTQFIVDDLLEKHATQALKEQGSDIADVLVKFDWRKFKGAVCDDREVLK